MLFTLQWGSTEVRSSISNSSTVVLDSYGRCLQRVLDQKIHKLRSITDESITTELDRIVCRLMKLALHATKGQRSPPPMSWLQQKLFDLLSLTEKAIERRRRHYFENFALKAIEYCNERNYDNEIEDQDQITEAPLNDIMTKYQHVITPIDEGEQDFQDNDMEFDNGSVTSVEINEEELDICNDNYLPEKSNIIDLIYRTDEVPNIENLKDRDSENVLHNNNFKIITNNNNILPEEYSISNTPQEHVNTSDETKIVERNSSSTEEVIVQNKKNNGTENRNFSIKINKSKHSKRISSKTSLRSIAKLKKVVSIEDGNKRIKTKKYKKLQSKLSKPIPDSLVNLCNMDENEEFKENNRNVLNDTAMKDISNNEDCLFISIVTESDEETLTLRRNTGTDPDPDYDINNETASETVINITKHDSFENVQSQTIFILDINEPSTSKGVRNISTDVQCGPDLTLNCALSPVTSLVKTPKLFNNGIKIDDSFHNIFNTKKTCDFGMCTEYNDHYIDISRGIGIKIKDSDINFHDKKEFPIEKSPEILSGDQYSTIETKILKHVLPKIDDSVSEFCDSIGSLQKSLLACSSINTSESQIQCQNDDNTVSKLQKTKIVTRELVHGGVHVHSFKDKMVSQDIIYQGEWKRTPKNTAKKQSSEIAKTKKKVISKHKLLHTKEKMTVNSAMNKNNRFPQKLTVVKNKENTNVRKVFNTVNQKTKSVQKISTTVRVDKNVTKVVSKITVRTRKTKSIKSFPTKKATKYNNNIIAKNDVEVYKEKLKNYLPRYLRRKIQNMNTDINNTKAKPLINNDIENTKNNSESKEITKNLLKVQDDMQHNVDYLVFQNGIDVEPSVDKELILSSEQTNTVLKYDCNMQSHNSSTCSSPNSVATVRPIAQNRVINNYNNKTDQSNSGLKSEITSSKYKYPTHYKHNKKGQLDVTPKTHSNKENIPQSSKNIISKTNKTTKTSKSIFKGKNKNVLMHNNEHVTMKSSSTKFSKRPLKKSFTPVNTKNNNERNLNTIDCCKSNNILIKENLVNMDNENISTSTSDANDSVGELTSLDKLSLSDDINDESSTHNDCPETSNQSVHETTSSIMSVIRKLLQEKIQLTENKSKDSLVSNSDTVILNKDELDRSVNSSLSPVSMKTVLTNEDVCTSESELEAVNTSNDTNRNQLPWSYIANKTPVVELDSLSYMSVASTSNSKYSEYYLADNELDSTLIQQADHLLDASSVQEMFEPKEENKNSIASGFLEVLSGFSANAETLLSDNINLTDSEIGSLALTSARLTASEELFASGRSSDTYESCFFDDDTYVPNWLFDVMSQQQSNDESDALDEQLGEAMLDANGNVLEPGVGATSGAGDGKGIHSDNSQDSSGRGTSLSSTASSGPENEAILIDLSAVAAYEPLNASSLSTSEETDGTDLNETPNQLAEGQMNTPQVTSSIDGDVSSMGTDAIDSDN